MALLCGAHSYGERSLRDATIGLSISGFGETDTHRSAPAPNPTGSGAGAERWMRSSPV